MTATAKKPTRAESMGSVKRITDALQLARGDHAELAELLCRDLGSDVAFAENRFWRYCEPIFAPVESAELSTIVQAYAGRPVRPKCDPLRIKSSDVSGTIKLASDRLSEPSLFERATPGLAFADCFVAVLPDGLVTLPHSPDHRARAAFPFAYSSAEPSAFLRLLCDVWRDDADRDEKIAFLQEFGGACLTGIAARFALALVFYGKSAENGKSTVSRVLEGVMPSGTTAAIPPHLWASEYRRAQLAGVRLNVVAELPSADISDAETFKAVVAGDPIDARPIREAPFKFSPIAGHLFATNELPSVGDLTWGFFRRLAVLTFSRQFPRADPSTNVNLSDEILKAERPAIVAWLLAGAARLLARGNYALPASSAGQVESWRRTADSVSCFVTEQCEKSEEGTKATPFFAEYREWATANGFRPVNAKHFSQRLGALGYERIRSEDANRYPLATKRGPR